MARVNIAIDDATHLAHFKVQHELDLHPFEFQMPVQQIGMAYLRYLVRKNDDELREVIKAFEGKNRVAPVGERG